MGKLLSRAAILAVSDIEKEEVFIKEWNGSVIVTGLTGTQKSDYEATLFNTKGTDIQMNMKNAMTKLVVLSVVDENGKQMFEAGDIEALGGKSGKALSKLYAVAARLSGITKEDMKELTENLNETPNDSFTSN